MKYKSVCNSCRLLKWQKTLCRITACCGLWTITAYFKAHNRAFRWYLLSSLLLLASCSNLRYLQEDEKLYKGSKVKVEADQKIDNKQEVVTELERVIRPEPNERILFWRPRLWFYNIAGEDPQSRWRKWVKNRVGRPPVLWQDFDADRNRRLMENRLFNMGFFDGQVSFEARERKKTARALFSIELQPAFVISEVLPLQPNSQIAIQINEYLENCLLRPGDTYRLDRLKQERERITQNLKKEGYFFFHPDFLVFQADTTMGNREVKLALAIKPHTPQNAFRRYHIRNVVINANHTLDLSASATPTDSLELGEGFYLLNNQGLFKPETLRKAIFFESGKMYSSDDHDLTLNHLMGLGVFKFVNLRFEEVDHPEKYKLDLRVQLSPMEKKTLSAQITGVSKSTGFVGPGMSISFANRNLTGGAEHFNLNLEGSWETLLGRGAQRANSLEAGISSELTIPRFVAPFGISNISPRFIPRTRMSLAFNYLSRTDAFNVSTIRSQFGYIWNYSVTTQHRYTPFVFSVFSLGNISDDYRQLFSEEVLFRRGLFEQFLIGSEYSFYYNSQLKGRQKHAWFLNLNLDLSGNLLYAVMNGLGMEKTGEEDEFEILGQSFAQYSKADFDLRYYLDMGHGQKMATRLIAGIGVPYGNSSTLPYIKLFTTGGSNSIRAFHPRALGPGSYNPPDTMRTSFNIYQSGEIKLELNVEYRFDLSRIVKGALFADAGNVWNLEERERAPGGQFDRQKFVSEIALGAGTGLRFDFTFFVLRLDLAFPLAVPYDDSSRYFQSIRPWDRGWRKDNLLLNLAIGYPF